MQDFLITLMALGAVVLNVIFIACLIALLSGAWRGRILDIIGRHALVITFILSALSLVGSLFVEYIVLLAPCDLCWWQRIFMYPIALITGVAFVKNVRFSDIADYVLVLAVPGAAVALYQHLLQMLPAGSLLPCDASGDCAVRSVFEFGYVTFPWLAFSIFALLILTALVARRSTIKA